MQKEIFRKEALDRVSSPEQLDELLPVTSPRGWMALAAIGTVLAVVVGWSLLGQLETSVYATGALIREGGSKRLTAPSDGRVTAAPVAAGDSINPGEPLLQLEATAAGQTAEIPVVCDQPGRVLYVSASVGDQVRAGDVLIVIEFPDQPMQAVVYVPAQAGYQIQPGQTVEITQATTGQATAQVLRGAVKSAGRFPAPRATILRSLDNQDWVDQLAQRGPLLEVVVELPQTEQVAGIFQGTPCTAQIIVSRKRPIEFVFPLFSRE